MIAAKQPLWTGELALELLNRRGWSVGPAELTLRPRSVVVRHDGHTLGVLDRDWFRRWLTQPQPDPYLVDELAWTVQLGITFLMTGTAVYRVAPETLKALVEVI